MHRGLGREAKGGVIWSHERPKFPNYPSPVVYNLFGKDQMLMSGCDLVTSLNPLTGNVLWEIEGSTTECVVTMVTDGERAFTGGGYPRNHTVAVRADGSGKIAWQNSMRIYVPSMIVKNGHLYATWILDSQSAGNPPRARNCGRNDSVEISSPHR